LVNDRVERLTVYQNAAYANRYKSLVAAVVAAERAQCGADSTVLADAVARYYFKLLAYKDEYEVARLYAAPEFQEMIAEQFDGNPRLEFNLAPALLSGTDPVTGAPTKRTFGPWILHAFKVLAAFRGVRGTSVDPFGYQAERKAERKLIAEYETVVNLMIRSPAWLTPQTVKVATKIAAVPEKIRGFGHVKAAHIATAKAVEAKLLQEAGLNRASI
jgi:indolepyruvate ferredoxin oxidoreductase